MSGNRSKERADSTAHAGQRARRPYPQLDAREESQPVSTQDGPKVNPYRPGKVQRTRTGTEQKRQAHDTSSGLDGLTLEVWA